MMAKKTQRPIDVKDMPHSHMGKDALDAAAERVFNTLRDSGVMWDCVLDSHPDPYHLQNSETQTVVQRAVLNVIGSAVPAILRQRAKDLAGEQKAVWALEDLATELETDHG